MSATKDPLLFFKVYVSEMLDLDKTRIQSLPVFCTRLPLILFRLLMTLQKERMKQAIHLSQNCHQFIK